MYLKSLTLKGFKSFADRSHLVFEPGMTVVVGPNGSGKSNISDAILWVLGEQSAKQLRGNAMEDVIFSGSSARKAVGVAEVDLVLDNSDKTLPLDFNEIALTRRMYRSGESEYLINGSPSRLIDVQDILHDSGLGKDTHSIISQGKLDAILQSRPEERRVLIEEAAGISKHKKRKQRSMKKVERMDKHLTRARDIQREINRQLRPLEKQVDRAQKHKVATEELNEIETILAVDDLRKLKNSWSHILDQEKERDAEIELLKYRLAERERELSKCQVLLEERGLYVGDLAERRRQLQRILERLDAHMRLLEEKGRNMVSRLSEMRATIYRSQKQLDESRAELEGVTLERDEAQARNSALHTALLELREQAGIAHRARQHHDEKLAELNSELRSATSERDKTQLDLMKTKDACSHFELEDNLLVSQLDQVVSALTADRVALREKRTRIDELADQKAELEKRKDTLAQELSSSDRQLSIFQEKRTEAQKTLQNAQAQLNALMHLEQRLSQENKFDAQLKDTLMNTLNNETKDVAVDSASLSRVAHAFIAPAELEGILEYLLSDDVNGLIVSGAEKLLNTTLKAFADSGAPDGSSVLWDIAALNQDEQGRPKTPSLDAVCQTAKGTVSEVVSLLNVKPDCHALVEELLNNVFVCDDETDALRCARSFPHATFITRSGMVASRGARVALVKTATQEQTAQSSALARAREIDALKKVLPELEVNFEHLSNQVVEAEQAKISIQRDESTVLRDLATLSGEHTSLMQEVGRLEKSISQSETERLRLDQKRADARTKADEARPRIDSLAQKLEELVQKLEALEEERAVLVEQRDGARHTEREAQDKLSRCQLDIATVTERLTHLESRFDTLTRSVSELAERVDVSQTTAQSLEIMRLRVEPLHETYAQLLERATQWAERLRDQASLEEAGSSDLKQAIADARSAVDQVREQLDGAVQARHELDVTKATVGVQVESALKAINEREGVILEDALMLPEPENREELEERLKSLKSTLSMIGPVNHVAMEEYTRLKERASYIEEQLADLEAARKAITRIIAALDRKMRDKFLSTFAVVNSNFEEIFSTLFPGGSAHLELTDPENPAETGVEVVAQPRGKRITKMMLLSGGEKSLTALALLFAVYKTRTVPFYVLDEVEAALDDSNLNRLLGALNVLRDKTQFIVVSHQRRTMECADVLYGVSMQADGVSRVVSQRLEHLDKEAGSEQEQSQAS